MPRYLLRRLLGLLPTLWFITVLTFWLTRFAPVDRVHVFYDDCGFNMVPYADFMACMADKRQAQGWDLPDFYLTVSPLAEPATLNQYPPDLRDSLRALLFVCGDWARVAAYRRSVEDLLAQATATRHRLTARGFDEARQLDRLGSTRLIEAQLATLQRLGQEEEAAWLPAVQAVRERFETLHQPGDRWRNFVPTLHWHGWHNQYHRWLTGILRGDWGQVYGQHMGVEETLARYLPFTLLFAGLGTCLVFLIGIPLGVMGAVYPGSWWDRGGAMIGILLQVVPTFWVATLLFTYFADPERSSGLLSAHYQPFLHPWTHWLQQMPLPLLAFTYGGFAQLSRLMRSTLREQMAQPYLRAAQAKGLSYRQAVWRHALRNAMLPLITVLTGVLPGLLVGSVVIERAFHIEGMGQQALAAVQNNEVHLVMALFTLTALLTLLGYFLADVLYAWFDPRVSRSLGKPR